MSVFSKLFIFCSGASVDLLEKCPRFETTKYVCIGLTVFFTALLAVISSFFAFSLIFNDIPLTILFSLLWGAIIFNLDRYIVSTMRHDENKFKDFIKIIPRLIVAFLIAIIISKPLEIQIFKNEIQSHLMIKSAREIANVDLKYASQFKELSKKKSFLDSQYNSMLLIREKYYEEYKCECDGTCGTKLIGRGIECLSKKEKYSREIKLLIKVMIKIKIRKEPEVLIDEEEKKENEYQFMDELALEKIKRDSTLVNLHKMENILKSKVDQEITVVKASVNPGLIDYIRALNEIDKWSSIFIIFIFVMIETAPIFTKLLSSIGPYDNLVLEYERAFETNYLKALDNFDHERKKNIKLKEMTSRMELKSKESEIQSIIKQEARDRYEKIRTELEKKTFEN